MVSILKNICSHPFNVDDKAGGVFRFAKWQIRCLFNKSFMVYPFTGNSNILVKKGLTGVTGNIYCGLLEFDDMGFLLHFLRKDDLFVDVGANVGAYTILASSEVGARSISIEPIPSTFKILEENVLLNGISANVSSINVGVGKEEGVIKFTKSLDTVNHVAVNSESDLIEVEVSSLDTLLKDEDPALIKVDVEGYEVEVVKGASSVLNKIGLKAVIIETNGSGQRYGFDEQNIYDILVNKDFRPYHYDPKKRLLTESDTQNNHNTIYIRDYNFVIERIKKSRKYTIGNKVDFI